MQQYQFSFKRNFIVSLEGKSINQIPISKVSEMSLWMMRI